MFFTTTKKKQEKVELFPGIAVLTQLPYTESDKAISKTTFVLSNTAMSEFGFPLNTPNVSKLANGFDDANLVVLAAVDTGDIYTSNITAKNTFSSQKLLERLVSQFDLDPTVENNFLLDIKEHDGIKYAEIFQKSETTNLNDGVVDSKETVVQTPEVEEVVVEVVTESVPMATIFRLDSF